MVERYLEFEPDSLEEIKLAKVTLPDQPEPMQCFICQLKDGTRVMSAGVFVSGLVYERMPKQLREALKVDETKWDWQKGIFRGGLAALGVAPDKIQEELTLFEEAQPDSKTQELFLGPAVELDADGQMIRLEDEILVWMTIHQGADIQIIEELREIPEREPVSA